MMKWSMPSDFQRYIMHFNDAPYFSVGDLSAIIGKYRNGKGEAIEFFMDNIIYGVYRGTNWWINKPFGD